MRTCKACHCSIEHKRSDAKYCSVKCLNTTRLRHVVKICVSCGIEFEAKAGPQKTCGDKCRSINNKNSQKRRDRERVKPIKSNRCIVCGSDYKSSHATKLTCGSECSKLLRKENQKKYRVENIDSSTLRVKIWRKNNPERYKQNYKIWMKKNTYAVSAIRNRYNEKHPEVSVRSKLKSKLGFTPDDELVELATMRRLINREIRKAGE